MNLQPGQLDELYERLSPERLTPYLRACSGDRSRAIALYEWNAEMSAALWVVLAHTEVVLRNALHDQLTAWSQQRYGDPAWYLAGAAHLEQRAVDDIGEARRRATRNGRPETPGRVVAELNFGFWRYLLATAYDSTLWRWCLRRALPLHQGRRHSVSVLVGRLNEVRNRIAHHEPIHRRRLDLDQADALRLTGLINPTARDWIADQSRIDELLRQRPGGS